MCGKIWADADRRIIQNCLHGRGVSAPIHLFGSGCAGLGTTAGAAVGLGLGAFALGSVLSHPRLQHPAHLAAGDYLVEGCQGMVGTPFRPSAK